jgi:hypothetical protein
MTHFVSMADTWSSFAASGALRRVAGLSLALLVNWLVYALTFDWRYHYVCKCMEDVELFDVPLSSTPIPPRIAWRGDRDVTPPRALPSSEVAEQALRSTLSVAPPHRVRFIVNVNGRVGTCTVNGQVPSAVSADAICDRLRPLRFHPATDRDGLPIAYVLP